MSSLKRSLRRHVHVSRVEAQFDVVFRTQHLPSGKFYPHKIGCIGTGAKEAFIKTELTYLLHGLNQFFAVGKLGRLLRVVIHRRGSQLGFEFRRRGGRSLRP